MGISNDAREFLDAAKLVRREKPVTFTPTYFLACQSIELSIKAYLRGSGYSDKQLRDIGHNLDECIAKAKATGVDSHVKLSPADVAMIAAINPYYQFKDFQYSTTGYKSFPHPDLLIALAERLWSDLRQYCEQHRDYHFGKPTAIL
jgi:HEPN domain-containing protein